MAIFDQIDDITIHFSQCIGVTIYNEEEQKIGTLNDFFVDYEDVYPQILAIQYKRNKQLFYISWDDVKAFNLQKVVIKTDSFIGRSRTFPKAQTRKVITSLLANQFTGETMEYPALGKIILDKQIVDTYGKKVVRVNDIRLIRTGKTMRVTHAAVGLRAMFRRLGYEPIVDFVVKTLRPKSPYLTKETLINWKYVHAIPNRSMQSSVKLSLSNEDIKGIHPADLADILEDLDTHGRGMIFTSLDPKMAAETLSEVEDEFKANLLKNETTEDAAKIIANMDTDDAADVLSDLSESKKNEIIDKIEDNEIQEEIQELLEYQEDTAGGLMTTEIFEVPPDTPKTKVLSLIRERSEEFETIYDIFVTDKDETLLGICTLHDLLLREEDTEISEIMKSDDIKSLTPDVKWKEIAHFMSKYNLMNVPITGEGNRLLGIVSVDDILPWLLDD